eukprot:scaffold382770_cov49-Prasinocladus_malaysianus.AAC.1
MSATSTVLMPRQIDGTDTPEYTLTRRGRRLSRASPPMVGLAIVVNRRARGTRSGRSRLRLSANISAVEAVPSSHTPLGTDFTSDTYIRLRPDNWRAMSRFRPTERFQIRLEIGMAKRFILDLYHGSSKLSPGQSFGAIEQPAAFAFR